MKIIKSLSLLSFILCLTLSAHGQTKKTVFFYEIDDQARILVDGKKVYESDVVGYLGSVKIEVDISKYIPTGEEEVTIELLNIKCPDCTDGNPWGISFELIDDEEVMDYHYDNGEGDEGDGPAYSYTFYWNDL